MFSGLEDSGSDSSEADTAAEEEDGASGAEQHSRTEKTPGQQVGKQGASWWALPLDDHGQESACQASGSLGAVLSPVPWEPQGPRPSSGAAGRGSGVGVAAGGWVGRLRGAEVL